MRVFEAFRHISEPDRESEDFVDREREDFVGMNSMLACHRNRVSSCSRFFLHEARKAGLTTDVKR